jgi:hypothetical protein
MSSDDYVWKPSDTPTSFKPAMNTIACDKTGNILYAHQPTSFSSGSILGSNDGGKTWKQLYLPKLFTVSSIACDETGKKVVVCGYQILQNTRGDIFVSNDFGATFTIIDSATLPTNQIWNNIACDKKGEFLIVSGHKLSYSRSNNYVYISPDSGKTWTIQPDVSGDYITITSLICYTNSQNKICAALTMYYGDPTICTGIVYLYNNNQWTPQDDLTSSQTFYTSIASNVDGSKLTVCGYDNATGNGLVWLYDGTWQDISPNVPSPENKAWTSIALNGLGDQIMLVGKLGGISILVYLYENGSWSNKTDFFNPPDMDPIDVISNVYNNNSILINDNISIIIYTLYRKNIFIKVNIKNAIKISFYYYQPLLLLLS